LVFSDFLFKHMRAKKKEARARAARALFVFTGDG
jgi:hypothetical protein